MVAIFDGPRLTRRVQHSRVSGSSGLSDGDPELRPTPSANEKRSRRSRNAGAGTAVSGVRESLLEAAAEPDARAIYWSDLCRRDAGRVRDDRGRGRQPRLASPIFSGSCSSTTVTSDEASVSDARPDRRVLPEPGVGRCGRRRAGRGQPGHVLRAIRVRTNRRLPRRRDHAPAGPSPGPRALASAGVSRCESEASRSVRPGR